MSYAKMIHDYIDGGLDSTNEQTLFSMLSQSDEIRREFNTQFKMHLAAQEEMSQIVPPLHVTNAIFTGLGLALPANYVQSPVAAFKKFLARFSPAIFLLFFFGAIGWGVIEYQKNAQLSAELASLQAPGQNNIPVSSSFASDNEAKGQVGETNQSSEISGNNSINMKNFGSLPSNVEKARSRGNSTAFDVTNSNSDIDRNQNSLAGNQSELWDYANNSTASQSYFAIKPTANRKHFNNLKRFGSSVGYNESEFYGSTLLDNSLTGTRHNINIRMSGPTNVSPTLASSKLSMPRESYAVSFIYAINDFHAIGLEIAQENFTQNFITPEGLQYSQSPEIFMLGGNYRLTPKEFIIPYYLYPYLQQFAGYTAIGPVFKTQAGLIWQVASPVSFNLGFEYGTLIYNVGGTLYNSNKVGVTGGISIGF